MMDIWLYTRRLVLPSLLILGYLFVLTNSTLTDDKTHQLIIIRCSNQANFSLSGYKEISERHFDDPITTEFKCYITCLYDNYGLLTDEGEIATFDKIKFNLMLPDHESLWPILYELFKKCRKEQDLDEQDLDEQDLDEPCDQAFNIFKCVMNQGKQE